jgi:hypothetical protein
MTPLTAFLLGALVMLLPGVLLLAFALFVLQSPMDERLDPDEESLQDDIDTKVGGTD